MDSVPISNTHHKETGRFTAHNKICFQSNSDPLSVVPNFFLLIIAFVTKVDTLSKLGMGESGVSSTQ